MKIKKIQCVYRIAYLLLLGYGLVMDYQSWMGKAHNEFLVYYTSQSNILCFIVMSILLAGTIYTLITNKEAQLPGIVPLQFLTSIYILITCLIYNVLLGNPLSHAYWFTNSYNWIVHLAAPILFIIDFFLWSERGQLKKTTPLFIMVYPYLYVAFIMVRSFHLSTLFAGKIPSSYIVYPYFFLDLKSLHWSGLLIWMGILTIVFISLGYLFYALYNYQEKNSFSLD